MGAEGDIEYTEEQERLEAERADPAPFTEEDQLSGNVGMPRNTNIQDHNAGERISGNKIYDQLNQEEEILGTLSNAPQGVVVFDDKKKAK